MKSENKRVFIRCCVPQHNTQDGRVSEWKCVVSKTMTVSFKDIRSQTNCIYYSFLKYGDVKVLVKRTSQGRSGWRHWRIYQMLVLVFLKKKKLTNSKSYKDTWFYIWFCYLVRRHCYFYLIEEWRHFATIYISPHTSWCIWWTQSLRLDISCPMRGLLTEQSLIKWHGFM
jgi:hypothetical protein